VAEPLRATSASTDLARKSAFTFVGSATSALMGFVLTVVLARALGDVGSGLVLQAIGVFAIALSLAKLGMDSTAIWALPRASASDPTTVRMSLVLMLGSSVAAGSLAALLVWLIAPALHPRSDEATEALQAIALFLPAASVAMVALAATRGLGGVVPFVALGNIALPAARPLLVAVAALTGASVTAASLAWAAPLLPTAVIALAILWVQVRRTENGTRGPFTPTRAVSRPLMFYALPRTLSAGLEQGLLWIDIVLVGILAGPAAAGIYGAASRFVAAGLIVDTALRVVVSPRMSALLSTGRLEETQALYRTAATWLVLFGAPIYLVLATFGELVLSLLGPGFEAGALPLLILCAGAIITFCAGNVHTVLLMSGRSGWAAINKAVVLAINVGANFVLVPVMGIVGAAISWAACMLLDAVLASVQVRRFVGIGVSFRPIALALLVAVATVGAPSLIFSLLLGQNPLALAVALAVSAVLYAGACFVARGPLELAGFRVSRRS
jgi:O-antigen/teichoic acid export membrane protein